MSVSDEVHKEVIEIAVRALLAERKLVVEAQAESERRTSEKRRWTEEIESKNKLIMDLEMRVQRMKLCTRCGSKYDASGSCLGKPCQGGIGEWCLEHHGAPFYLKSRAI
jgi:hypothetical protein